MRSSGNPAARAISPAIKSPADIGPPEPGICSQNSLSSMRRHFRATRSTAGWASSAWRTGSSTARNGAKCASIPQSRRPRLAGHFGFRGPGTDTHSAGASLADFEPAELPGQRAQIASAAGPRIDVGNRRQNPPAHVAEIDPAVIVGALDGRRGTDSSDQTHERQLSFLDTADA